MSEVPLYLVHKRVSGLATGPAPVVFPYRTTSLIRNRAPLKDPHGTLGLGLRQGPWGVRFLVSEVPL